MSDAPSLSLPTHADASRIAEAAKRLGYTVSRSAASPRNRSAYVFCDGLKVRVADHADPRGRHVDIDVHIGDAARPGSVTAGEAIKILRRNQR
jgi:hypothetical protein